MNYKKILRNACVGICCLSLVTGSLVMGVGAKKKDILTAKEVISGDVDYNITNPYANVNWNTYKQYKTDLHSHTTATDGDNTLVESVEKHYDLDFDIVATTDHGTTSYSWTEENFITEFKTVLNLKDVIQGHGFGKIEVLKEEGGTASNGNLYKVETDEKGDDYYYQYSSDGTTYHKMMRVPYGIENNPTSLNNAHVCSWFADYGNGILGGTSDYITPIKNIEARGGLSVINHPGEYSGTRHEVYTKDAYDSSNLIYAYKIEKWANILNKYKTCIGLDINSKGDYRTRFDRKLWDIILKKISPLGRNVFAIASTDAHNLSIVDSGYVLACLPECSSENLKKSLANGEFFAASKYVGNVDELIGYSKALRESGIKENVAFADEVDEVIAQINVELEKGDQGTKYYGGDFAPVSVSKITVDDKEDTISLETENGMVVSWIADGKVIATGNTIDLDDYSNEIGCYVRAEVFGKGGIVYTQPFTLSYEGAPEAELNTNFVDLAPLASAVDYIIKGLQASKLFTGSMEVIYNTFFK